MELVPFQIALIALASGLIAGIAYKARVLDLVGTILAFLICFISGTMGHWSWLLILPIAPTAAKKIIPKLRSPVIPV